MKQIKFYIYPLILFLLLVTLTSLKTHGSSIAVYNSILNLQAEDNSLIFGEPREIRSDEFVVSTPILISQNLNNNKTINKDIGEGTNIGTNYNVPNNDIFSIFKPATWSFLIIKNSEFAFSLFWWSRIVIMLLGVYILVLELTQKNILISICASLAFLLSPMVQWWLSIDITAPIGLISFSNFFFIKLVNSKNIRNSLAFSFLLAYSIISFGLFLYPPFQIPLIWSSLFLGIAVLIKYWREKTPNKKDLLRITFSLLFTIILVIFFLLLFIKQYHAIIKIIMGTVYPGTRFVQPGGGNLKLLLNGFFNILLQSDTNIAPFGNQSESSNFLLLFPPIVIWVIFKNISSYIKKHSLDWYGISLSLILLFFSAWYFLPLPKFTSQITFLYMVPQSRLLIGFGFSSYLLMLYILSRKFYKVQKTKLDKFLAILLSTSYGIITYSIGKNLYALSPNSFNYPKIINPDIKIILSSIFVFILLVILFWQHRKIFLTLFFGFSFISTFLINPLYKGLDVLINTELARYIQKTSIEDDSRWVVYGNHTLAQYALANNAKVLNGVHIYPQFEIWEIIDPEAKYQDIYNRYAHIAFSEKKTEQEIIEIIQADFIMVNINPCDTILKKLDIKYVMTTIPLEDTSCLTLQKRIDGIDIYILE
jgi:hypothetical protein